MATVSIEAGTFGWDYQIEHEDGRTVLVQTDTYYPSVATNLGWSPRVVGHAPECPWLHSPDENGVCTPCDCKPAPECPHDGTDGTVDCSCGVKALTFIQSAQQWLDDHLGETFEDPGYFTGEG
jgi:hypothetical protein